MSVVSVVGAQWGDEGKGKIIDLLAEKANAVVRYSGGDNAGHTVINPFGEFKLHIIPSGIFHHDAICIIGNGVAINPAVLLEEIDEIQKSGIDTTNLFIDDRAHLIMPYHLALDGIEEEKRGGTAIGTTRKGIGPVFTDKIARHGIRAGDLLDKEFFYSRLSRVLEMKNVLLSKVYDQPTFSLDEVYKQYCHFGERLAPFIRETSPMVREILSNNGNVLMEGAQGTMLDPDFGTYPYVTSSSPLAANCSIGAGIGLKQINYIIGIAKAYTTRVGGGPMPAELHDEIGHHIRERAHEYGTTTGRPRRCGWFDAMVVRFSVQINGFDGLVLTRLDILDDLPTIKICTGYTVDGKPLSHFPGNIAVLEKCEPIYEELPGWQSPTSDIRKFEQLPPQAIQYVKRLEEVICCPVDMISVGAKRDETIVIRPVM